MKRTRLSVTLLAAVVACGASQGAPAPTPAATPANPRSDSVLQALQRQIGSGSIIADAQIGRNPPTAVGACVHPVEAARWEMNPTLAFVPDVPPQVIGIIVPELPPSLRDSEVRTGTVVARWVVDTTGLVIPGSLTIVSSPHGLMSLQVCGAILGARFTPAKDDGRRVFARVELPVRFVQ